MTTWKTTYISAVVHQSGDNPIINEQSTTVTICDEAGGAFISLTDSEGTTIKLDPNEFKIVANVANGMLECFEDKPRTPISVVNEAFNKAEAIFSSLKSEMLDVCVWMQDSDGSWATSCGKQWEFISGDPKSNEQHFCHHCGGVLLAESFSDDAQTDME